MPDQPGDRTPQFVEYLETLRRRKWTILVVTVLAVGAALAFSKSQTPIYDASAKVLIQSSPAQAILGGGTASNSASSIPDEIQRLESPAAKQLRSKEFRAQFNGLTLADFYKHDYYAVAEPGSKADKVGAIQPPQIDAAGRADYHAALRGIRKNLILLDTFVYGRRFEPYFERAQKAKGSN